MSRTGCEGLIAVFLAEAGDQPSPGEVLCGKLGLSPSELLAGIEGLRQRGFAIDSAPGGYRMTGAPDRPTPEALESLLTTRDLGRALLCLEETTSTSEVAFLMASENAAPHGQLVLAEAQTKGRGRLGRSWISPAGVNLYGSLVLRPALEPRRAPELPLVAGVALAEALADFGAPARIKWPNDVELRGRKVAGILSEMSAVPERLLFVVLGLGINVNADPLPSEIAGIATSLKRELGRPVSRVRLLCAVLARLEDWLDRHEDEGFAPVRARWVELSSTLGSPVDVEIEGRVLSGEALDIDESGALLVRTPGGVERVLVGDVRSARASGGPR